jgi:Short C-terminal domain
MVSKTTVLFSLIVAMAGCAITRPIQQLTPGAENVSVGKDFPGDNYKLMGPVNGLDGTQCGLEGYRGSYDGAVTSLKNRTHEMGGDYAQIIQVKEPHWVGSCFNNEYVIEGTAYKKVRNQPLPIPSTKAGEEKLTKQLRELKKLFDDGILTQEEYEQQKARLLKKGFEP